MNGVIVGRVVDATGAPVAGARVMLTSGAQPVSDLASLTDAQGRFRRSGLTPGSYEVAVHKTGHAPAQVSVAVGDGQEADVEVRLGS
jgi:protocatechuate 3,4-dioxygenase beta subunit